jgi:hypothetical protein
MCLIANFPTVSSIQNWVTNKKEAPEKRRISVGWVLLQPANSYLYQSQRSLASRLDLTSEAGGAATKARSGNFGQACDLAGQRSGWLSRRCNAPFAKRGTRSTPALVLAERNFACAAGQTPSSDPKRGC